MSNDVARETIDGVIWSDSALFKNSFDSHEFLEKSGVNEKSIGIIVEETETSGPAICYVSEDDQKIFKILMNIKKMTFSSLYELLSGVYTTEFGKEIIPSIFKHNDIAKEARKTILGYANMVIELTFQVNASDINKYQKDRDQIRTNFAHDISYCFPIKHLLKHNPLRDYDGSQNFNRLCQGKMSGYAIQLLSKKNKQRGRKGNTYRANKSPS